jgi:hypothetical protein
MVVTHEAIPKYKETAELVVRSAGNVALAGATEAPAELEQMPMDPSKPYTLKEFKKLRKAGKGVPYDLMPMEVWRSDTPSEYGYMLPRFGEEALGEDF